MGVLEPQDAKGNSRGREGMQPQCVSVGCWELQEGLMEGGIRSLYPMNI